MAEIEPSNQVPAHVLAWRNASAAQIIPSHVSPDGNVLYVSERDLLVDEWFRMKWQIKIGPATIWGPLMFFEPAIYTTPEGLEPEFEIEVEDENGLLMYIRAHYARFEPLS